MLPHKTRPFAILSTYLDWSIVGQLSLPLLKLLWKVASVFNSCSTEFCILYAINFVLSAVVNYCRGVHADSEPSTWPCIDKWLFMQLCLSNESCFDGLTMDGWRHCWDSTWYLIQKWWKKMYVYSTTLLYSALWTGN